MASAKSSSPKVSIITLNYFGIHDTLACLESLSRVTYPNFEVLVFDNGSSLDQVQTLREYAEHHAHVRFIDNKINLGFAAGNNVGISLVLEEGESSYIYFLNNDTEVEPDFLTHVVEALENKLTYGIAASLSLQYFAQELVENAGHEFLNCGDVIPRGRHLPKNAYTSIEDVLGACSAGALYRVETLKEIGGYSEDFFLNYEDMDLSLRSITYGWKCLLVPKSQIYHKVNASISKVRNYAFMHRSQVNQLKAYLYNTPTFVLLCNLPWILLRDVSVVCSNILFFKWNIVKMFLHGRITILLNIRSVLKIRQKVIRNQKISSWYILSYQKNFLQTYFKYFWEIIITGKRSVLEDK